MKTIVIYFDAEKKRKQVIKPTEAFWKDGGDIGALVEHITKSDRAHNTANYFTFQVL
jgi:hypothetical protein